MAALSAWSPLTVLAVILGYAIVAAALVVAPMVTPLLREARQARREGREPTFVLFQPYPAYSLRYRRSFRLLLIPPALLVAVWLWGRITGGG